MKFLIRKKKIAKNIPFRIYGLDRTVSVLSECDLVATEFN
jgi:hypothetical protein